MAFDFILLTMHMDLEVCCLLKLGKGLFLVGIYQRQNG